MKRYLRILTLEPYAGDSHMVFLNGLSRHSRHQWQIVTLPARHWKWRMRSAPLALIPGARDAIKAWDSVDAIFCSDMLDLPTFLGFAARDPTLREKLVPGDGAPPIICYFHENQWTYPTSPDARPDHHFGYTNILSALASDACWFNSSFHLESFLKASQEFVRRMPDSVAIHDLDSMRERCVVIPPGFPDLAIPHDDPDDQPQRRSDTPIRIGWTCRWEYDKRPDRFADLLDLLKKRSVAFELILLGQRHGRDTSESLVRIRDAHGTHIIHDGYAESSQEYAQWLSQMDVVVSTADHEFFGIGICEAAWAGAVPVVPNRLSYVEILPEPFRYESLAEAAERIEQLMDRPMRRQQRSAARLAVKPLRQSTLVPKVDAEMARLCRTLPSD